MESRKLISDYFSDIIEYPESIAENILPYGTLWEYVSSTFLNGFVNYVTPLKIFVLDRYSPDKTSQLKEFQKSPHTNLSFFEDDVILLSKIGEGKYMYFWFDMDISDCCVGRFKTSDSESKVIRSVVDWLDIEKQSNKELEYHEGRDNGILNYHELPISSLSGWVNF